ncbi:MAG TPA: NIPSNAP family protein [Thermoanaerobaculaceae bacterium]|nr:NIPSNAP family protein [Thermoanaerobaculaceae bacterium]
MIVVRNVFHLKFGKAKEARALMKEGKAIAEEAGFEPGRVLTDLSGRFYTLVMENSYPNLAGLEKAQKKGFANKKWEEWYHRFVPLVESGHREIFHLVED